MKGRQFLKLTFGAGAAARAATLAAPAIARGIIEWCRVHS